MTNKNAINIFNDAKVRAHWDEKQPKEYSFKASTSFKEHLFSGSTNCIKFEHTNSNKWQK